jgi:isopenicillin N synthase-like dioxygenase
MKIPVLDLQRSGAPAALDHALSTVGFMRVRGHGLDPSILDATLTALDDFWSAPLADKLAVEVPAPEINRGYSAPATEAVSYTLDIKGTTDLFEAFTIGPEDRARNPAGAPTLYAPNLWPAALPGLRTAFLAYYDAARSVADVLMAVAASALGLPSGWFQGRTARSADVLRALVYDIDPATQAAHPSSAFGLGAHTDYGVLTVLWADPLDGLEIVGPDGEWLGVVPEPGELVVNIGDLLSQWTNDRWRSTIHRVVPPAPGVRRRSLAFFHNADPDVLVECIPSCAPDGEAPRYEPVLAGAHYQAKLVAPRALTPALAASTVEGRRGPLSGTTT